MVYNRLELINKLNDLDCECIKLQDIKNLMKNKKSIKRRDKIQVVKKDKIKTPTVKIKKKVNYNRYNKDTYKEFNLYIFYNNNKEVLYVGRTTNLKERMRNHFYNPNTMHNQAWKKDVSYIDVCSLGNFETMCVNEVNLINTLNPIYNINDTECDIEDDFDLSSLRFVSYTKKELEELIATKEVFIKDVLVKLREYLISNNVDKFILSDWIRENFYNEETSMDTIKSKIKENIEKIKEVCNEFNYKYVSLKGRGKKGYIEKHSSL